MQTKLIYKLGNRTFLDQDLSPPEGESLWESCPVLARLTDPSILFGFEDDFDPFDINHWTVTSFTSGTVASGSSILGGTVSLNAGASTSGQGVQIQRPGMAFGYGLNKKLWMEARLQTSVIAGQFFWGLAPTGTVLAGGAVSPSNWVGFHCLTGDGSLRFSSSKSGGTVGTSGAVTLLAASTMLKLGLVWDMLTGTLTPWVNGVASSTPISASTALPTAILTPSLVCLASGTGAPQVDVDWVRVFQIR